MPQWAASAIAAGSPPLIARAAALPQAASSARLQRFAALCGSPALLREVEVQLSSVSAADSFALWLMRHGRQVHTLNWAADARPALGGHAGSFASAVATCLAVAGLVSQLDDLTIAITSCSGFHVRTDCLRTMGSLPRLTLSTADAIACIAPAIARLTALQSLEVRGPVMRLPAELRLPSSITRLGVGYDGSAAMLQQASFDAQCVESLLLASIWLSEYPKRNAITVPLACSFASWHSCSGSSFMSATTQPTA